MGVAHSGLWAPAITIMMMLMTKTMIMIMTMNNDNIDNDNAIPLPLGWYLSVRGLVSFILLGVAVLFRGQQLAPYLSIGSSVGGQVNRKATRISKTLQRTVKGVVHCE